MTREEAIFVLECVRAHGLADEAKQMAIEVLKAESRKHGHWVCDGKGSYGLYKCSKCNEFWSHWYADVIPIERMNKILKFCPNCGAKMDEVGEWMT